jgi:two-component system, NtrC family, sensor kinase
MERLINLNYRNRMTAGLHGQVVEESYAHLKEKAAQLQVSEEKYRALAMSLEQEVACKGEEIRETQLAMLQQERLASIGRLAAGMAHEINNPIGFVISNLNTLGGNIMDVVPLLSRYGRLLDRLNRHAPETVMAIDLQTEMADITRLGRELDLDFLMQDMQALIGESLEGAERIKSIVQHLKDFAHPSIETAESVDINHCLDTTLAMLEGQIAPRVVVRKNYTAVPAVCCHLRAMNQVFFHLLQNALQAVGDCGEIVLGTRHLEGSRVEVTITDSGPGIAKEHLPHIFDPFFTTREVGAGIGLGLYLAHGIVKKQGGVIVVENAARGGCTFHIRIPVM